MTRYSVVSGQLVLDTTRILPTIGLRGVLPLPQPQAVVAPPPPIPPRPAPYQAAADVEVEPRPAPPAGQAQAEHWRTQAHHSAAQHSQPAVLEDPYAQAAAAALAEQAGRDADVMLHA